MDDHDFQIFSRPSSAARPLLGLTILVVEDSRFACEALRLLCLRSGARIRRADCLKSARRHLQVYRPSVVIVDLGLPDGSGAELIEEMNSAAPRVGIILGTSGDDMARATCVAAGADGFLAKPVTSLATFQQSILALLPADRHPGGPRLIHDETVRPDRIAYQDDMAHAADILGDGSDDSSLDYVLQFLNAAARSAEDFPLVRASENVLCAREKGHNIRASLAHLAAMVQERQQDKVAI